MVVIKKRRTLAKTLSWRLSGTIVTAAVVFLFTNEWDLAIKIGGIEVFLKMFFFYLHERVWNYISFGRMQVQPMVLWFTGLSVSGKSTIAKMVEAKLKERGFKVERLDGDRIRSVFPNTGFTREARDQHIKRVGFLASMLEKNGVFVIASLVSPYAESRKFVRELCQDFHEVYVSTPLEECEKRDVKGLYAKARRGEIKNFTGIDDPYEAPVKAEININTTEKSIDDCCNEILKYVTKNIKHT